VAGDVESESARLDSQLDAWGCTNCQPADDLLHEMSEEPWSCRFLKTKVLLLCLLLCCCYGRKLKPREASAFIFMQVGGHGGSRGAKTMDERPQNWELLPAMDSYGSSLFGLLQRVL
jgi:hypothetical protein